MYTKISILTTFALPFLANVAEAKDHQSGQKPNIIFVLSDDHRWNALGCMGNPIIQTPNLDALAAKGTLFKNAFVTTSICCCSRASILSGQYTARHGIIDFLGEMTDTAEDATYPLLLKNKAGYYAGFIGKYGVGLPGQPKEKYDYWTCENKHQPNYEMTDENGKFIHHTDQINKEIQRFFEVRDKTKPFCLSVSFKAPHCEDGDPRQFIVAERFNKYYTNSQINREPTATEQYWLMMPDWFRKNNEARRRYFLRFDTDEKYSMMIKNYYRLLTHLDEVVGNMLQTLKKEGLDQNTVVIFMGDNGFFFGEHGLAGKWFAYNESVRVPMIIADLRKQSKEKIDSHIVLNIDIAPTILSYAGIPIPVSMQGKSLIPLVEGKNVKWRNSFYYEHFFPDATLPKSEAIVSLNYKYIRYPEFNYEELFDEQNDSLEIHNLAGEPKISKKLYQMRHELNVVKYSVK